MEWNANKSGLGNSSAPVLCSWNKTLTMSTRSFPVFQAHLECRWLQGLGCTSEFRVVYPVKQKGICWKGQLWAQCNCWRVWDVHSGWLSANEAPLEEQGSSEQCELTCKCHEYHKHREQELWGKDVLVLLTAWKQQIWAFCSQPSHREQEPKPSASKAQPGAGIQLRMGQICLQLPACHRPHTLHPSHGPPVQNV